MSKYHLLIEKFIDRTISPEERKALEIWVLKNEANKAVFRNRIKKSNYELSADFDSDLAYRRFLETLKSKKKARKLLPTILKYAAVLAILLTIGILAKRQLLPDVTQTSIQVVEAEEEKNRSLSNEVIIKMADGSTKVLHHEGDELVSDAKGNTVATKGGNTLSYKETLNLSNKKPVYNEVFIPHGQIFKLKLSDGTKVWLNAGSKLRFPQNLVNSDNNRIVYLEGEAFFDVAKNKDKPFIVNTQEVDIKVLGTKFNISSYETDGNTETTLAEGSVRVYETRTPENGIQLTPGFQANYDKFGNNFNRTKVDTDMYTAWMQNRLVINNMKFSEILVKLERKYAVQFVNKAESLRDEIYRGEFVDEDIETVLKTIALSTPFEYEINQDVITITR